MQAKIVVRLLGAGGELLGWELLCAEGYEGALRSSRPLLITVEQAGVPAWFSYHWTDLNIQARVPYAAQTRMDSNVAAGDPVMFHVPPRASGTIPSTVAVGDRVTLLFPDGIVIRLPSDDGPLPPVTVRASVRIGVPTGTLAGQGV